jgi:TRAP-type mannitol/chloroaromatic compound transport system permease small subunit
VNRVLHFIDLLSEWIGKASAFLVLALSFVIGYEVVARYLFNRPTIWAHELSAMIFGAYIILGGAYLLSAGRHVNMDLIYGFLSPKKKALIDIITFWFFALFCVALVWKGGDTAWYSLKIREQARTMWSPPLYPIKLVLPIGAFLLLLQGIAKFIRDAITLAKGGEA